MSDIVTRKFGHPVHDLEHSRNNCLQEIRLFADDFICDLIRQGQNALQAIEKARRHFVIFVPFLQELSGQALPSASDTQGERTDLKRDTGNTEYCLCDRVQLKGVNVLLVSI